MRCTSIFGRTAVAAVLLSALAFCGIALFATGCKDNSEQEMMQQMMARGNQPGGEPAKASDRSMAGSNPAMAGSEGSEQTSDEGEAAPEEPIDNVIIESVEVKAPYPEFDGEGRYDVRVSVLLKEFEDAQVYRIAAMDADGNEVGSQEKHLKLPLKKARTFDFNEFYCTHMPTTLAFYRTDKEAIAAGEAEGEGKQIGRGVGGGGGGSEDDNGPGAGRGVAGG